MTEKLITTERLCALARINRWGGWVRRDYSVLEHEVIGALTLRHFGHPYAAFLLHDHEESEFGDIVKPVKELCASTAYRIAVEDFDARLWAETGVRPDGGWMDEYMAHAEHLTVAIRGDRKFDNVEPCLIVSYAANLIRSGAYADRLVCVNKWKDLWHGNAV